MLTTERRIMKSLLDATHHLPSTVTERDSRFVLDRTTAVMTALLGAEEPINKSQRFYDQANRTIDELKGFILHRYKEDWTPHSTFSYEKDRLSNSAESKRKRRTKQA